MLFVRTGYVAAYKAADAERRKLASESRWVGLGQGRETAEWLWSKQFAAVASDCPGFETIRKLLEPWACTNRAPFLSSMFHVTRRASVADQRNSACRPRLVPSSYYPIGLGHSHWRVV